MGRCDLSCGEKKAEGRIKVCYAAKQQFSLQICVHLK
jgi:hypothetical protein